MTDPAIQHISDTARWAAVYRARESEREDALFRDPFARRLAGERGEHIAKATPFYEKHSRSWVVDAGEKRSQYGRSRPEPLSQLGMIQREPPLSGMR